MRDACEGGEEGDPRPQTAGDTVRQKEVPILGAVGKREKSSAVYCCSHRQNQLEIAVIECSTDCDPNAEDQADLQNGAGVSLASGTLNKF